jgi:hypothetical protein
MQNLNIKILKIFPKRECIGNPFDMLPEIRELDYITSLNDIRSKFLYSNTIKYFFKTENMIFFNVSY